MESEENNSILADKTEIDVNVQEKSDIKENDVKKIDVNNLQTESDMKENYYPNLDEPLDLSMKKKEENKPVKRSRKIRKSDIKENDVKKIDVNNLQTESDMKENYYPNLDEPLDLSMKKKEENKPVKRSRKIRKSVIKENDVKKIDVNNLQTESDMKENYYPDLDEPLDLSMKKNEENKPVKRSRKISNVIGPRSPKRSTQLSKQPYKFIDEAKLKKSKVAKERAAKKKVKFATPAPGNCGAVYSPPSPISQKHLRSWPVEGMHERPEYDPTTGIVEPIDYRTRSIADKFNEAKNAETGIQKNKDPSDIPEKDEKNDVLSHIVLHRVITYVATTLQIQKQEREFNKNQSKIRFFSYLGLKQIKKSIYDEDEFDNTGYEADIETGDVKLNLKEILKNATLNYCVANAVDQSDLAKYIDSLTTEDIVNMSNEQNASLDQPTSSN